MRFSSQRLGEILGAFPRSKILVIGDLMLDEFLWGKVTRISPEAPVPVVDVQRRASYPGGAANVARNLASLGAKVMQSRSVEFAKKFGVVFEVHSSLNENPGTIVKEETKSMEGVVVRGVALDKNQAKVTLVGVPDKPGVAAKIFKALGDATVNVDMIIHNISHGSGTPSTDISFTTDKADLLKAQKVIESLKNEIGFREAITAEKIGKLSIVGVGMKSHTGVAGKLFETLAQAGVNIDMISTSEIKISVVIDLAKGEAATKVVHAAFIG